MGAKLPSVETVFGEAMEIAAPADRAAFLDRACGGDAALRRQVESLLDAHARAGGFLESPASTPTVTAAATPRDEGPGGVIGPYRLLEEIGEGGMGTVYMAEQTHPVRRKVALKVIKPGMDTRQVVARFEAERQALALMDHPNIARVLDAGATDSGRPYFVMELVRGLPITEYCDREGLTVPERLELFVLACRAVQHAHQKGIIHRDLKPSNVLVTVVDGVPTPKVIDFGVAKATGASLTERSLFTGFHQLIGTPLYMSPEQADLSSADVDTRSDVYALGVLLYELLTGSTPFDRDTFAKAAFDEMRRIIREDEPPTPSTRLSSLGESLTTVSARRGSDPRRLNRSVRGELDWIAMKALEKDRRRRYETANDLAADVMRYLTDKPVEACPPTARYRFSKYARRHRAALTTAALVVMVLVFGMASSSWQAARATAAEHESKAALTQAQKNLLLARKAVDELYDEVELRWLGDPQMLPLPESFLKKTLPFYQLFAKQKQVDLPAGRAHRRVGEILIQLGKADEAKPALLRAESIFRALLAVDPENAQPSEQLADCLMNLRRIRAIPLANEEPIQLYERLAARFPEESAFQTKLARAHLLYGHNNFWQTRMGSRKAADRHMDSAVEILERLCAKSPDDPDLRAELGTAFRHLADIRRQGVGNNEESEAYSRRAFAIHQALTTQYPTRGAYSLNLAWDSLGLGITLILSRKYDEVVTLESRAATIMEGLANEYPGVPGFRQTGTDVLGHRAIAFLMTGNRREAEKMIRQIESGKDEDRIAANLAYIAWHLVQHGAPPVAEPGYAVELAGRSLSLKSDVVQAWHVMGMARYRAGQWDEAIAALTKANELEQEKGFGFNGFFVAMCYHKKGDVERAKDWYDRSVTWMAEHKIADPNASKFRDEAAALMGLDAKQDDAKSPAAAGEKKPPG